MGMEFVYEKFDNAMDYVRATQRPIQMIDNNRASVRHPPSPSWCDCTLDESRTRVTKGFSRGTQHARDILLKITPYLYTIKSTAPRYVPGVIPGTRFMLDNYVRGIPELMYSKQHVKSHKFVSILVNLSASAGVDSEIMFNRGCTMVALSQALERHNYRVSIKCCFGQSGGGYELRTVVNLKGFNERIELDRLAFFLADPSAFRRLYFCYMESQPMKVRKAIGINVGEGYGRPVELDSFGFKGYKIDSKDIYLGCASLHDRQWHTIEGCIQYLRATLRAYGIEMRG